MSGSNLSGNLPEGHGLYIHWPWCRKKCPYCDFNSHVVSTPPTDDYLQAMLTEMRSARAGAVNTPLTSVFFGGGTPSLMSPSDVETLLNTAEELFGFAENIEITLEANPTSSEASKFKAFAQAGVNRFSIGMQSPEADDLDFLGREHNRDEALSAIQDALAVTPNVSLDLIYGLPNQSLPLWEENLRTLTALGTPHISCYQLTIEKNTKLYADMNKGKLHPISDTDQANFYHTTNEVLIGAGFEQYEVSNYSRNNAPCRHNLNIWRYGSYIGIGAGAHGRTRQQDGTLLATRNYKMPEKYIQQVSQNSHGRYEAEPVSPDDQVTEALLLGLRLSEGLPLKRLESLNQKPWPACLKEDGISLMTTNGFLQPDTSTLLKPTPMGMAMLEGVLGYITK